MKFLVIRFSSIGDIVLATPAIRCLKQQVPDAEVHFLSKASFKAVTEGNPYIDRFHYLTDEFAGLVATLKAEQFDYIVDLHDNFRTRRIAAFRTHRWHRGGISWTIGKCLFSLDGRYRA